MTIHGAGFSARPGVANNEKSKAAGEGISLAMCHPHAGSRYLFSIHRMAISSACKSEPDADWQQAAISRSSLVSAMTAACGQSASRLSVIGLLGGVDVR